MLEILLAGLITAILLPYFSHFLGIKKSKREASLSYLEKAYDLAQQFAIGILGIKANITWMVLSQQQSIDINKFPIKSESISVDELIKHLDYHLNAPPELIKKIEDIYDEYLEVFRPFLESIYKSEKTKKEELHGIAIGGAFSIADKISTLEQEILDWIKSEKIKIESELTPFQCKYWIKLTKNGLYSLKKYLPKRLRRLV